MRMQSSASLKILKGGNLLFLEEIYIQQDENSSYTTVSAQHKTLKIKTFLENLWRL